MKNNMIVTVMMGIATSLFFSWVVFGLIEPSPDNTGNLDVLGNNDENEITDEEKEVIFLIQGGVFSKEESVTEYNNALNAQNISSITIKGDDFFKVYLGVCRDETVLSSLKDIFKIYNIEVYAKPIFLDKDHKFLDEIDKIESISIGFTDADVILSVQKEVLSKYEELVVGE